MAKRYADVVDFLKERGIGVTPEAEEYALRYAAKLASTAETLADEEIANIQNITVLRGAEVATTNNLSTVVTGGGFEDSIRLTADHVRIATVTAQGNCLLTPPCIEDTDELNDLSYVTCYSGEVERLRSLNIEDAQTLAEWDSTEILDQYIEKFDREPHLLRKWFEIRTDIWGEIAEQISAIT